ncbi:hypothetical protein ALNOE001_16330 [Candidatus Methanobinarius endosymbioticus]|uniref:Uncharacterized protein n=1 Tax=Candidatus Methanobinarius endosymbioticus TaxID=2006182 RepID=A0A366M8Z9_9EURY|nr:hypothetical protein ALNOE001_16330 [Candidatus Methanobinarius endosymbioticus]
MGITNSEGKATIYYKDTCKYPVKPSFECNDGHGLSNAQSNGSNESLVAEISGVANMKEVGVPIIAILLALIANLGLVGYRKRTKKTL